MKISYFFILYLHLIIVPTFQYSITRNSKGLTSNIAQTKKAQILSSSNNFFSRRYFRSEANFQTAAKGLFALYSTFTREEIKEAKQKIYGMFDQEDLKITASLSMFANGYHIPFQAKLFFNKEKDNSLDYEIYPGLDDLKELVRTLESRMWEFINDKKIFFDEIRAFTVFFEENKDKLNPIKALESEPVKNYLNYFKKKMERLYKKKMEEFEDIQAFVLIHFGNAKEKSQELKEKITKEFKEKLRIFNELLENLQICHEILKTGSSLGQTKLNEFKTIFSKRLSEANNYLNEKLSAIKDKADEEYLRLSEQIKINTEKINSLDINYMKNEVVKAVKPIVIKEYNRFIKNLKSELELYEEKSNEEYSKKLKIYEEHKKNLKKSLEDESNLLPLIADKISELDPYIKQIKTIIQGDLDFSSILKIFLEPLTKRLEKQIKKHLCDLKNKYRQAIGLKLILTGEAQKNANVLKDLKEHLVFTLQENLNNLIEKKSSFDSSSLDYYYLGKQISHLEGVLKKEMDIAFLKEHLLSKFREEYEIQLKAQLKKANAELELILDSKSEEYLNQEIKIKELQDKIDQAIYDPEEIKRIIILEVERLEKVVSEIEAIYKKGIDQEHIKKTVLESLKTYLKNELIDIINEKKNEWDVLQDKSSAEAKELKAIFEEAKKNLNKDFDLEKVKANVLNLYESFLNMVQSFKDHIKYGFNINVFKNELTKSLVSKIKEEFKKELASKLKELKASELNQASNIDDIKKEITKLEESINIGINLEKIKKGIFSKMEKVKNLISALENNFKKGIDSEQIKTFIQEASDKVSFFILEALGKKAAKHLLYSIFPFAAPLVAAYEFITDANTHLEPKNINILDTGFALDDFRFKRKVRELKNISHASKYMETKFDFLLNQDPYVFAKITLQINGGVIMEAFNKIGNFMGDLITKAWNLLGEEAKKRIQNVFKFAGDVVGAVKQMAESIIKDLKNLASLAADKIKQGVKFAILTAKQFLSDASQAISIAKEVGQAFLRDMFVGPLQNSYKKVNELGEKIGEFSKNLVKLGDDLIMNGLKELDSFVGSIGNLAKESIKTLGKAAEAVGDFAVAAGKETVKAVGKTVDFVADSAVSIGKGTVKIVGKTVDAVADTAVGIGKGAVAIYDKSVDVVAETSKATFKAICRFFGG